MFAVNNNRDRNIAAVVVAAAAVHLTVADRRRTRRRNRQVWMKKYRGNCNDQPLLRELRENYPEDYRNYLRMDWKTFEDLLGLVKNRIKKMDTIMRESITAEQRLTATLRFLATGRSYEDLQFSTGISAPSLSKIIPETCKALYHALRTEFLKFPNTKDEWRKIAEGFHNKWDFVNCGGAMDGKHIRIVQPSGSGAFYYNYKNYYSIVLMALVDSNCEFIFVDVGKNGRLSDGGVIEHTEFMRRLNNGQLHLPENDETIKNLNFAFVGDEAFALKNNFLKPYAQRELDHDKRVYNYRLSRARNVVENTFGILSARFRVFHTAINMKVENISYVVLATCVLHNFLRRRSASYLTLNRSMQEGNFQSDVVEMDNLQPVNHHRNINNSAKQNRDHYKEYFVGEGSVPWQEEMLNMYRA